MIWTRRSESVGRQFAATPADRPDHALMRINLAIALRARYESTGTPTDREEATAALQDAAESATAAPSIRVQAARAAAELTATAQPDRAAKLLRLAIRLLPEVAPRALTRPDQQHAVGEYAGMASDAAALALEDPSTPLAERPLLALRLLEAGRAVLLSQALQVRNDITELARQHPDLAADFVRLRDFLDRPPDATAVPDTAADPVAYRARSARELNDVLARIRAQRGFESFALPPSAEELIAQADRGPVVVFNISGYRSDALLLTAGGATCLPLPGLSIETVIDQVLAFHEALQIAAHGRTGPERQAAQRQLSRILEWLWDNAAGPVLDALGYRERSAGDRTDRRVWWIPGGLLGLLPIHAAGYHTAPTDSGDRTVLDRVVSSYTPTLAALRHARQRSPSTEPAALRSALIVAMPTTPGVAGRLHHVADEVRAVATHLSSAITLTETEPESWSDADGSELPASPGSTTAFPTKAEVLHHLTDCAIAHFACHGTTDPADPSRSHLLLHDHDTDPLTVAELAPVHLDHARLAYLSACETALTANTRLLDEAIHLASAFQLAGYPHVIGTLWTMMTKSPFGSPTRSTPLWPAPIRAAYRT
ncbi:CHAT domain-containing protein [Nocardia asteroides]